jgi:hypothetical protein
MKTPSGSPSKLPSAHYRAYHIGKRTYDTVRKIESAMTSSRSTDIPHQALNQEALSELAESLRRGLNTPDLSSATLPHLPKLEAVLGLSPEAGSDVAMRIEGLADALEGLKISEPASITNQELAMQIERLREELAVAKGAQEAIIQQRGPEPVTIEELRALWRDIVAFRKSIPERLNQTGDVEGANAAIAELRARTAHFDELAQTNIEYVLGKNLLGAEAWKRGFGVDVGEPPPVPESITPALLNSPCPLHPGQLIKETHILMLVPQTVNGDPYSALKLDELCSSRKGSGDTLIYDGRSNWKRCDWAILPQVKSEWVLLPKSDPDRNKVPFEKHFRRKEIPQQQDVHKEHYLEYREAKALEVMTMALLSDLVHGEPRILDGWNLLRCMEPTASGGRVCVGYFAADGLRVDDGNVDCDGVNFGRALARKP